MRKRLSIIAGASSDSCHPPPAEIGVPVAEVETPALIIDLDALDRNIAKMAEFARASGVRVRPHARIDCRVGMSGDEPDLFAERQGPGVRPDLEFTVLVRDAGHFDVGAIVHPGGPRSATT
jgi:hypothetical protein